MRTLSVFPQTISVVVASKVVISRQTPSRDTGTDTSLVRNEQSSSSMAITLQSYPLRTTQISIKTLTRLIIFMIIMKDCLIIIRDLISLSIVFFSSPSHPAFVEGCGISQTVATFVITFCHS